jgi:hypothetical protein
MPTYTVTQTGTSTATLFTDGALGASVASTTTWACARFDLGTYNPVTERMTGLTLVLATDALAADAGLALWAALYIPNPGVWSTATRPSVLGLTTLAGAAGLAGATSVTFTLPGPVGAVTNHHDNGSVLNLAVTARATVVVNTWTLTSTITPAFTGLEGPVHATGRADHCPKCGQFSTRDLWLRDGYLKVFVCESCYDPPDEYGRVVPRAETPGVNED